MLGEKTEGNRTIVKHRDTRPNVRGKTEGNRTILKYKDARSNI